jgi:hypothetical protein
MQQLERIVPRPLAQRAEDEPYRTAREQDLRDARAGRRRRVIDAGDRPSRRCLRQSGR